MASSLDELLKSIRDEAKKESALVAMNGVSDKDDQLVDEEIDERVLRLLGIEDVFDIDYATYKTLLKERMMAARMSGSEIPTEEAEVITNEFKRVKPKEGRFKVKKKKISVGDIRKSGPLKGLGEVQENPQKLLAPAKEEEQLGPIDSIIKSLSNIVKILQERNSLLKKQRERNRKALQNQARGDREARAEAGVFGKVLEGAKKVIAPVQNLLGKIFEIFMKIIFGRFLVKFVDWFSDPENQGKINAIGTFLRDHWPKLLAAYLLFGNSLGRFVVRITATLVRGAATLLTRVLPQLLKFVAANPTLLALAAGTALFGAGAVVPALFPQTVEDDADKQANEAAKEKGNEQAAADIRKQNENRGVFGSISDFFTGAGQEREEQAQRLETGEEKRYGFFGELAGGGRVSGPSGTDVVPARLTDGEFVMSKGAVDAFGTDFMESINAAGGGNNRPKKSSGTIYAAGGGQIGARRGSGYGSPKGGYDTGSIMNNPLGALDRILGQSTGGKVRLPGRGPDTSKPDSTTSPTPQAKEDPKPATPAPKQETSADQTAMGIPEKMLKSPTFRDSGLLYLRSMLGGFGGRITEQDLSQASKDELNKAIARARKRTAGELAIAEKELAEAKAKGFNAQILAERQSVVDRLKRGEVRVEYQDYYEGGKISPAAEDAKSILGKFWAATTENGGYKVVNERYDFVDMKDPLAVLMGDSSGVSENAKAGKPITLRQRLQAMHQLNPFARDMSVDMVLGQEETTERKMNNVMSKLGGVADFFTLNAFDFDRQGGSTLMNPSGKPQDKLPSTATPKGKPQPEPSKSKLTAAQIKNNQAYAASKGKYYSSTTGKTYASYADALKDPAVAAGAAATAKPTFHELYNPLDPKNMTPAQRSRMPAPPGPPVQKTPTQIFNEMVGIETPDTAKQTVENTLPSFSASSQSTDTNRTQKLFGIF